MIARGSEDVHRAIAACCERGAACAVAVVLQTEGSTPCTAGAKAVIQPDGAIVGTVGGGAVEAETQRRACDAMRSGQPVVFDFQLAGGAAASAEPICGGRMRLLVAPLTPPQCAAYAAAAESQQRRRRGVLLTSVGPARPGDLSVQFFAAEAIPPELGFPGADAVRAVLDRGQSELFVCEASDPARRLEVFVEPLSPRPLLLIVGGGHVGQALAAQADLLGFAVAVIDDRPEFTDPALFPQATISHCGPIGKTVADFPFGDDTYVVIVTRDHRHDAEALAECLHRPAAYVGMIGSRRKVALMRQQFVASGRATAAQFDRVYAPVGLDIGAATVPEIAASIVAQLIAVRRKGVAPRIAAE